MAVTVSKTFIAGEILTATDLNGIESNITANGEDLAWPATKAKDLDGQRITLDSDGDTHIVSDTDDRIDFEFPTGDHFRFDGSTASAVNGLDFTASATGNAVVISAQGTDSVIDIYLKPKGADASFQDVIRSQVFGA